VLVDQWSKASLKLFCSKRVEISGLFGSVDMVVF